MAKTSSVYRNLKREKMVEKYANRRLKLSKIVKDKSVDPEERFLASLKLAELPRTLQRLELETVVRLQVVHVVYTGNSA